MLGKLLKESQVSKFKTLLRFEAQNLNWSLQELTDYSNAFFCGIKERQIPSGKKTLLWLDENHGSEFVTSALGSYKAGLKVSTLEAEAKGAEINPSKLRDIFKTSQPSLLVVSPNQKVQGVKKADLLAEAFPELRSTGQKTLQLKEAKDLKFIVQTGFYEKPGLVKFRDFMFYQSKAYARFPLQDVVNVDAEFESSTSRFSVDASPTDQVFVVGGFNNSDLVLRAVLEAIAKGSFVNFVSEAAARDSNLEFINDVDHALKVHVLAPKALQEAVKAKVTRKATHFIGI